MAKQTLGEKEYQLANKILSGRADCEKDLQDAESCGLDCSERRERADFCRQLAERVKQVYFAGRP